MSTEISEIQRLQKRRLILNCLQFFPLFRVARDVIDNKKQSLVNALLDKLAKESDLYQKYKDYDISSLRAIGTRVWVFWYTGIDTAPPVVKKCISIIQQLDDADLVILDKNNLSDYFVFEGNIKEYFEKGLISIQTFSDILRCQLLSRFGGFWLDSTLFVTREDIIKRHKDEIFFSIRHLENDLLLKKKWNEYFTKGRWSIYCIASGINNPLFSFIYEMYIAYYKYYETSFDYFQTDYIWLYAYAHFEWTKSLVDALVPSVKCSFFLGQHLLKPFDKNKWNQIMEENEFQKLNWRITGKHSGKLLYYDYFMNL